MIPDPREDQLLCPVHYSLVEPIDESRYVCTHCPKVYDVSELTSAKQLGAEMNRLEARDRE